MKGKEFILLIQKVFNEGKPLPFKYKMFVKPWKQGQTRDWVNIDESKFWTPSQYLRLVKEIKEWEALKNGKNKRRKKSL